MRINWIVVLLAAIFLLLLLVFVVDVTVSEDKGRNSAPVVATL